MGHLILSAIQHLQFGIMMESFHIRHKWSLSSEGVSSAMTFDLDLYLRTTRLWTERIQYEWIVWVIIDTGVLMALVLRWWAPVSMRLCPLTSLCATTVNVWIITFLRFRVMCCMLNTFHVSSWVLANITESAFLFFNNNFWLARGKYQHNIAFHFQC